MQVFSNLLDNASHSNSFTRHTSLREVLLLSFKTELRQGRGQVWLQFLLLSPTWWATSRPLNKKSTPLCPINTASAQGQTQLRALLTKPQLPHVKFGNVELSGQESQGFC